MSSNDNSESDQFKLISLENQSIKPVAQKAKQAYNSYLKDDDSPSQHGTSNLNMNEDDPPPAPPASPQTSVVSAPAAKAAASPAAKSHPPQKQQEKPKSVVNKFKNEEQYEDDDSGDSGSSMDNINAKIGELKESLSVLWDNFYSAVSAIVLKVGAIIIKPIVAIAEIFAKLMSIPLRIVNRFVSSIANKLGIKSKEMGEKAQEPEPEPEVPEVKMSSFSEMTELNILFTDNYKKNLYNKPQNAAYRMSKMEENLIVNMAIEAIKECAEFTMELPPPGSGIYQGIPISKVMEEVSPDDVYIFLGFVKAFPGKYIGKTWKISETFATWLINNSPTG